LPFIEKKQFTNLRKKSESERKTDLNFGKGKDVAGKEFSAERKKKDTYVSGIA